MLPSIDLRHREMLLIRPVFPSAATQLPKMRQPTILAPHDDRYWPLSVLLLTLRSSQSGHGFSHRKRTTWGGLPEAAS